MQRQRLPAISPTTCSLVGSEFLASSEAACMIWPDWQYPHCGTCSAIQAFCSGWSPLALSPSMVVIFLPTASLSKVWQDLTASPLTWTVQAPHRPAPQPNLVPVICNCSRITQSSGVLFAASTDRLRPLIVRLGISFSPFRCRKPLTAATHCWVTAGAHRVRGQLHRGVK